MYLWLIFVAEDHFAIPLAAAISNVIANLGWERKCDIFIVDGGISSTNREKVIRSGGRDRVRIQWHQPSESHGDLLRSFPCGYIGRTPYLL
jgi:hypothetical protein